MKNAVILNIFRLVRLKKYLEALILLPLVFFEMMVNFLINHLCFDRIYPILSILICAYISVSCFSQTINKSLFFKGEIKLRAGLLIINFALIYILNLQEFYIYISLISFIIHAINEMFYNSKSIINLRYIIIYLSIAYICLNL